MTWKLLWVLFTLQGNTSEQLASYNTEAGCEFAKAAVQKALHRRGELFCVPIMNADRRLRE